MPSRVPPSDDQLHELEVLINAHHPLLRVESVEDDRVQTLLEYLADRVGMPLFVWSPTSGLNRLGPEGGRPAGTESLEQTLAFIERADLEAIFLLPGLDGEAGFESPSLRARLKEIYRRYFKHRGAVVVSGPDLHIPRSLEPLFTSFELAPPDAATYHSFVSAVLRDIASRREVAVELDSEDVSRLLNALQGLTFFEVQKIITQAVVEDGKLGPGDLSRVLDAKRRIVERSGVLEYFPHDHPMEDVAGLAQLKDWLRKRKTAFTHPERAKEFGLSAPRGLLLLGVQGCGKSLCAKAIAAEWGLPLLRLDPSNLYQKFFGESEKNLKRAIRTAEEMAPVVLWIDEIEKALGQGDTDGGTSQRVFGTFLAWLQEKKEDVFVIATANDISKLPPELLRKGRFDEIFFVDLPSAKVRESIFAVHLRRRSRLPDSFDIAALAEATEGFSGAEIEQAVISGLYTAFSREQDVSTEILLEEVAGTRPLSVTMSEKIEALRAWAAERAVPAE